MKTIRSKLLLRLFILSLLVVGCPEKEDAIAPETETITIKLFVDTDKIKPDNLSTTCRFEAVYSEGSHPIIKSKGNLECFTIDAYIGHTIVWEGVEDNNKNKIINIKRIRRENNSEIFKDSTMYGKKQGSYSGQVVVAKILHNTVDKDHYKYEIEFDIEGIKDTYKIDPKIKVGSLKPPPDGH